MTFLEQLRLTLERDEGIILEVYEDHLQNLTCGIGHLITEKDQEWGRPVGTE